MANQAFTTMHLVIRTSRAPSALTPELRAIMHDLDASVPFETLETMDNVLSKVIVLQRMEGWLLGVFAGLALFLAATGLYGLVSYEVQISVRSIGLRMAMGATRLSILNRVLRRVGALLATGIGVGSACLFVLQRLFARVITLDVPHDLAPMVELAGFLLLVGLSSAFLPALRAAFIQPMDALRNS
jgi:ABC-type antimicrobial peptide transport system permease subunit